MKKNKLIIQRNKSIAKYLGFPSDKTNSWWHHPISEFILGIIPPSLNDDDCRFHDSWDWIMPVIQKIVHENNPNKEINFSMYVDVDIFLGEAFMDIETLRVYDDIEKWHQCLSYFCSCYNDLYAKGQIKNILPA